MKIETLADIDQLPATIVYMGEHAPENWGAVCDAWRITINHQYFDYYTGLGHRKANKQAQRFLDGLHTANAALKKGTVAYKEWEKMYIKPVKPFLSSVLHCLIMEADAENMNYNLWCENYGYDHEKIKSFELYRACLKTAEKLHKAFTREQIAKIASLTAEM